MKCRIFSFLILLSFAFPAIAQISVSIPNMNVQRGATVDIPFRVTGLTASDSLVAYQLAVVYNPTVLQGVGASKTNTMTQNWDNPTVAIKSGKTQTPVDTVRVVGITTNQPTKRWVPDDGILVNLNYLIVGNVGDTASLSILEIRLFNKTGEISISSKTNGKMTVVDNPSQGTIVLNLSPNWNLVSFPIMPQPNSLPEVLGEVPVTFVFAYISGVGPKTWDKVRPSFLNDLKTLDGLHGYWMKLNSQTPQSLSLSGDPVSVTTPIFLHKSWNLIPYLPNASDSLSHAFQSLGKAYRFVSAYYPQEGGTKTWDRARPGFLNDLKVVKPQFGYWVKMDTAKFLVYPSSGYQVPKMRVYFSEKILRKVQSSPYWCDFWAFQPELLVPGDTVRVYDGDGVLCGDTLVSPEGAFLVHVLGDDPNTPEEDEGATEGDTLTFVIAEKILPVYGTSQNFDTTIVPGPAIWSSMGSKRVQFKAEGHAVEQNKISPMPKGMVLFQNYPNPFNGETMIRYQLGEPTGPIRIAIFDLRGREIRTWHIENKNQEGQVIWDGLDGQGKEVPTGMYFYRIEWGNTMLTKKCLLLK